MVFGFVPIQLYPVVIRIAQVNGLADSMIGCSFKRNMGVQDSLQRTRQRRAGGIDNCGVVEAGRAGRGRRSAKAPPSVQRDVVVTADRSVPPYTGGYMSWGKDLNCTSWEVEVTFLLASVRYSLSVPFTM